MADLSDDAIAHHLRWLGPDPFGTDGAAMASALRELQHHRAAVKRFEEWAAWLEGTGSPYNAPIAAEIRRRLKGD